jgi:hypothetical protein
MEYIQLDDLLEDFKDGNITTFERYEQMEPFLEVPSQFATDAITTLSILNKLLDNVNILVDQVRSTFQSILIARALASSMQSGTDTVLAFLQGQYLASGLYLGSTCLSLSSFALGLENTLDSKMLSSKSIVLGTCGEVLKKYAKQNKAIFTSSSRILKKMGNQVNGGLSTSQIVEGLPGIKAVSKLTETGILPAQSITPPIITIPIDAID